MKVIQQKVPGRLVVDGRTTALRLGQPADDQPAVLLTYALTTMGPDLHILPALALDDWGNEIKGLALYQWVRESGVRFPRAEVFGFDPAGNEVQYFLRDLELLGRYPVYAVEEPGGAARLVSAVLLPAAEGTAPQRAEPPADAPDLLRASRVAWWRVAFDADGLSFLESVAEQ